MELIRVEPRSLKELAQAYGVSTDVIKNWIKPFQRKIGRKRGWYYNVRQVKIIYERLGPPDTFIVNP